MGFECKCNRNVYVINVDYPKFIIVHLIINYLKEIY